MRDSFWTEDRLKELVKLFPRTSLKMLEKRYHKTRDSIEKAYEFQLKQVQLKIETKLEKGVKVTYYRAYDAHKVREPLYLPSLEYEDDQKTYDAH